VVHPDVEPDRKGPVVRKLYYTIGEVSETTGIPAHVLRYWETEFPQLRPKKGRSGNRTYQAKDLDIISRIRELLYDKRFTIAGAKAQLNGGKTDQTLNGHPNGLITEVCQELRNVLDLFDEMSGRGAAR
jgi:DNA-binding transcriptional MerR regulator